MKKRLISIAAATLLCTTMQAEIPFKILSGDRDTVYSSKVEIVCSTVPGTVASINGKQVTVYNTGAFGAEIELKEGDNSIDISLLKKGESVSKIVKVFYSTSKPEAKARLYTMEQAGKIFNAGVLRPFNSYGTTREGAYIQFGDGDDRLGGSKMGYLDAGVKLNITGIVGDLYQVRLSQSRTAYIPTEYVELSNDPARQVNSGTWNVSNMGKFDRVSIYLPEKLPYASWTQLDPTTICVDIFGAANNSNWIVQKAQLQAIDYVDWRQIDGDTFRAIIKLKNKYCWGYSIGYEGHYLTIDVKHNPGLSLRGMTIGIDVGHGGSSRGAVSFTGIEEKNINLILAKEVKSLLEAQGAKVILNRPDDRDMTMSERKSIFKENNIDLMVSIHNNAGGPATKAMGTSTYYKHITNRDLASCILDRLLGLGIQNYGLVGNFNFALCQPTEYPAVLVEGLFMSSLPDEAKLNDPSFRKEMAKQIVNGISDYLAKVSDSMNATSQTSSKKKR